MGPAEVTETLGPDVGPHPHIGLQTVTWLLEAEALHRDSLGVEQLITPGQLNLMTVGHGVAHAEEATCRHGGQMHSLQLWIAQPEATRKGAAAFEHPAELPRVEVSGAVATVLVGELLEAKSTARHDTPLIGAQLFVHGDMELPLESLFEYAVAVLEEWSQSKAERLSPVGWATSRVAATSSA